MDIIHSVKEWKPTVTPALESKVDELNLLGYNQATMEDVWNCLMEKVWKGNPEKRLYQVVQDIMHLDTSVYLSYLTNQSYQNTDLMDSISALLNTEKQG